MRSALRRLSALRARMTTDRIIITRHCRQCGAKVEGNPALTPCGQHPPAPAPQPGERVITLRRSYGLEAEQARLLN